MAASQTIHWVKTEDRQSIGLLVFAARMQPTIRKAIIYPTEICRPGGPPVSVGIHFQCEKIEMI